MLNIKVVSWSLGIFTAVSFVLCVVYGLVVRRSRFDAELFRAAADTPGVVDFLACCVPFLVVEKIAGGVPSPPGNLLSAIESTVADLRSGDPQKMKAALDRLDALLSGEGHNPAASIA